MIGTFAEYSGAFLRVIAVVTLISFSIPLLIAPLAWARTFRWTVDTKSDLALYFGRCLGAVALVLSCAAWHVAMHRELQPFFYTMLIVIYALLTAIHVVGALQKVQPWTETAEIPFWGALVVLGLLFYPLG